MGFEPTPPKRLVPKTSALDHSATLPDMEAQATLTSLQFIRDELVVAVDTTHKILKGKHFMIDKGALYKEVFLGFTSQLPLTCAGQIQNGG